MSLLLRFSLFDFLNKANFISESLLVRCQISYTWHQRHSVNSGSQVIYKCYQANHFLDGWSPLGALFWHCINEEFQFVIFGSLHCASFILMYRFRYCAFLFLLSCNNNVNFYGVTQFVYFYC